MILLCLYFFVLFDFFFHRPCLAERRLFFSEVLLGFFEFVFRLTPPLEIFWKWTFGGLTVVEQANVEREK